MVVVVTVFGQVSSVVEEVSSAIERPSQSLGKFSQSSRKFPPSLRKFPRSPGRFPQLLGEFLEDCGGRPSPPGMLLNSPGKFLNDCAGVLGRGWRAVSGGGRQKSEQFLHEDVEDVAAKAVADLFQNAQTHPALGVIDTVDSGTGDPGSLSAHVHGSSFAAL